MVVEVESPEHFDKLLKNPKYKATIVDFTATWCGPCQMIKPFFEEQSKVFTDIQFIKVDVDDQPDITTEAGIRAMPTFIIYQDGKRTSSMLQGSDKKGLIELIKKFASSSDSISNKETDDKNNESDNQQKAHEEEEKPEPAPPAKKDSKWKCTIL